MPTRKSPGKDTGTGTDKPPQAEPAATATIEETTDTLGTTISSALGAADDTAGQRVAGLNLVHQARLAQLRRTAVSVTAQYGANSSQAVTAAAKVTAAQGTVWRLAAVQAQVGTDAPTVAAAGWALYGRVYSVDSGQAQPVSAYCVFLVDAQNAYQAAYGFSYTDATGYFQLDFAGTPAGVQQDPTGAAPPALFIEIANPNGLPVYLSQTAFQPTLGVATYQNVTLPVGEPPIGDPPAQIRPIALPPSQTASSRKKRS